MVRLNIGLALASWLALSANAYPQGTFAESQGIVFGTFTNLNYIQEAGDVVGYEITVVPQYRSAYAIFQCAEGEPEDPVFVPVVAHSNGISFEVPDGPCKGKFHGKVTRRGMTLQVEGLKAEEFLPRRMSYWKAH